MRRAGMAGMALLTLVGAAAAFAPVLAPYDPWLQVTTPFARPSLAHPLGANDAGQDLMSELLYGARVSLLVGVLAAAIATAIGTTVGLVAGFTRGGVDAVLMRAVDVILALPLLPLLIVVGVYLGGGVVTEVAVIAAVVWARTAREIRAQVLSLRERSSVAAAQAMGAGPWYLLSRHLLPAVVPLLVPQLVRVANTAILLDASISFLGLGDPTAKSWGMTLYYANARSAFLTDAWLWWVLPPGLCVAAVVLGFALVGYALEARARPRLRGPAEGVAPPPAPLTERDACDDDEDAAAAERPLVVHDVVVEYAARGGVHRAVDGVSLSIGRGEALGIVGESGCGKTTLVMATLGLLRPPARIVRGRVAVAGSDLATLSQSELRHLRGRAVALIPQGAMNALNPVMTVGSQIAEAITAHRTIGRAALAARVASLLEIVGIAPERRSAYPHEFSGGMRQRVVIAMALANEPALLVADEPTTGLDLVTQMQILELLSDLRRRLGVAVLFVSHELPLVLRVVDRVAVMHRGRIVEESDASTGVLRPAHAWTRRLVEAAAWMPAAASPQEPVRAEAAKPPVLDVIEVCKSFRERGWLAPRRVVLDGVGFTVGAGDAVGVVGSSGVGKSTLARVIAGLERPDSGRVLFEGREVRRGSGDLRDARRRLHLVFQDPYEALPPLMRVRDAVAEPLTVHRLGTRDERVERVREALDEVALTPVDRFLDRYPHELSGGERQRVALARAIILRPRLIVADEPATMLDLALRLDLLRLMKRLGRQHAMSYVYITHDLALAQVFCDRLLILYDGRIVEEGPAVDLIARPQHPYTRRLVDAARMLHGVRSQGGHAEWGAPWESRLRS